MSLHCSKTPKKVNAKGKFRLNEGKLLGSKMYLNVARPFYLGKGFVSRVKLG